MSMFGGGGIGNILGMGLSAGTSAMDSAMQMIMTLIANAQNEQRYQQGSNIIQHGMENTANTLNPLVQRLSQMAHDNRLSMQSQHQNLINSFLPQYQALRNRGMEYIDQAGTQQRRDLNTQFDNSVSQAQADLTSRGLAATTVTPQVTAGINRQRSDALGALQESINQQRLSTDTALTNNYLQAGERMRLNAMNSDQAIFQQLMANEQNWGQMALNANNAWLGTLLGWIGNREDVAPDWGAFQQRQAMLGAGGAPPVEYPSQSSSGSFWQGFGGQALGAGATLGTAKIIFGCIDAAELVCGSDGWKPLGAVREGDFVETPRGYKRVMFADIGVPHRARETDYVKIVLTGPKLPKDASITLTKDHVLYGSPAVEWQPGDRMGNGMVVQSVTLVRAPELAGDLLLDGADTYYVNGFVVSSMLAQYGLTVSECVSLRAGMEAKIK